MSRFLLPWPYRGLWPNDRVHRMVKVRMTKAYRNEALIMAKAAGWHRLPAPTLIVVTFCPKSKGPMPDDDNRDASFKAARDGIAEALGVNDRTLKFRFQFGERSKNGGVIVEADPQYWEMIP